MGINDSLFGDSCKRCGKLTITSSEYYAECQKAGIPVDSSGGVSLEGLLSAKGRELTEKIGFKCSNCGSIYCHGCLSFNAPDHPSGGKACPKCGGRFNAIG